MQRISLTIVVNLLVVFSVAAQNDSAAAKNGRKSSTAEHAQSQSTRLRKEDIARRRFWLSMSLGSAFDTNISHDTEGLNSFGLVPSFGIHFRDKAERPSFEADYEVAVHRYTNTNEFDRVSQNFTALYRKQLAKRLYARTSGEISLKGSSEDREINNNYILEQQIQYRITYATRLTALVAYRIKRFPLTDSGSDAIDSYVGGKFEQRFKGDRRMELGYRYDHNRAHDPRNRYIRRTYTAEFSTPLSRELRDSITMEFRYSPRQYQSRLINVNGARVPRRDQRWVFGVTYERPLRPDLLMTLGYSYEKRNSNDLPKEFASNVVGVTFTFDWWK
jgi:hypothetical protein